MKQLDEYHSIEEIAPDTYRIEECHMVNCYLLKGSEKSLLIDAGCGAGNLFRCVEELTDQPVILAVTHRHPDHIGSAWQFGSYYAGGEDRSLAYDFLCQPFFSKMMVKASNGRITEHASIGKRTKIIPMEDGHVFDLGNRKIRVENVPGHTRGSMIFLEEEKKLMFTGDDLNPSLWMQLPGCTSLQKWLKGADVILHHAQHGYASWYGHGDGRQDIEQMKTTIALVNEIIDLYKKGILPKGKQYYPEKDVFPNVYYNSSNII